MAQASKRLGQLRIRAPRPDDPFDVAPLPIYLHPVVSISAILIVASIGQICVWLIRMRLVNSPPLASSAAIVHGWLYEILIDNVSLLFESIGHLDTVIFLFMLGLGLLSTLAWYIAIRSAFGPAWGLAAALAWSAHPGFALLVQQPVPLVLEIFLVPVCLTTLFWWKSSRYRLLIAPFVGLPLALLSLVGNIGLCMVPIIVGAMCFAGKRLTIRFISAFLCLTVYVCVIALWWMSWMNEPQRVQLKYKMGYDLWSSVEISERTPMAIAADHWLAAHPQEKVPSVARFLLEQTRTSPLTIAHWLALRSLRVITATSDGRFKRPLLALQLLTILPAIWGCIVALRYPPWRWAAMVGILLITVTWLLAALAEPLARNLAPIGGMGITFAFIGIADVYERVFNRRLNEDRDQRIRIEAF
jgi:hypothetical protein